MSRNTLQKFACIFGTCNIGIKLYEIGISMIAESSLARFVHYLQ